jgi:hypothetical protein
MLHGLVLRGLAADWARGWSDVRNGGCTRISRPRPAKGPPRDTRATNFAATPASRTSACVPMPLGERGGRGRRTGTGHRPDRAFRAMVDLSIHTAQDPEAIEVRLNYRPRGSLTGTPAEICTAALTA